MSVLKIDTLDDIAVVRLNNGTINSINTGLVEELNDALASALNHFKGMVLAGGEKFFSIGFDIPELLKMDREGMTDFFFKFNQTVLNLLCLPIPTACAIKGHAIAGGAILMLACDYRMAATGRTLIGLNEIKLGVPTPYLADMILRRTSSDHVASDIMYLGEFIDSSYAWKAGIVSDIFEPEMVEKEAMEKVSRITKFNLRAFAESKANRVELLRKRYLENHKKKNEAFLECWFDDAVQESLKEAAEKSFRAR